jgi:hypothetical protein
MHEYTLYYQFISIVSVMRIGLPLYCVKQVLALYTRHHTQFVAVQYMAACLARDMILAYNDCMYYTVWYIMVQLLCKYTVQRSTHTLTLLHARTTFHVHTIHIYIYTG